MSDVMPVLWCDIETTGLDPQRCSLLEVAVAITDMDLEILDIASFTTPLYGEESWDRAALHMHGTNGLIAECTDRRPGKGEQRTTGLEAAQRLVERCAEESESAGHGLPYLGGSSVHFDRAFLQCHARWLTRRVHPYRNVDVTSVTKLVETWFQEQWATRIEVRSDHRAESDIKASIARLRVCREILTGLAPRELVGVAEQLPELDRAGIDQSQVEAYLERIGSSTWGRMFSISKAKDRKQAAAWFIGELASIAEAVAPPTEAVGPSRLSHLGVQRGPTESAGMQSP